MHYKPPPAIEIRRLRDDLNYNNGQMAELFGVSTSGQFHKYLSEKDRREMGFHVLMYGMAQLVLKDGPIQNIEQVYDRAREYGAVIDLDTAGEQEQSQP